MVRKDGFEHECVSVRSIGAVARKAYGNIFATTMVLIYGERKKELGYVVQKQKQKLRRHPNEPARRIFQRR
jgi:hypothetical protein